MRRVVGAVLLALGVFLLVGAVLLPTYAASNLVTIPLNQYTISVATADNATVFDPDTLSVQQNVPLEATQTVRADTGASTDNVVVFDEFTIVQNKKSDKQVTFSSDRVGLDRRTAAAVKGYNAAVDDAPTPHYGLIYKWPFGAEKKTYQYFDTTTKQAYATRYLATEKIGGLDAYKYQMEIPVTKIGELDVPGNLVGSTAADVKAPRYYKNIRTIWVEPTTGIILKGQEEQTQTLRDAAGNDKLTLFAATLTFDRQTIDEAVSSAKDAISRINLLTLILPLVLGVVGLILVVVGLFLVLRRGGTDESSYRPTKPSDTKTPVTS